MTGTYGIHRTVAWVFVSLCLVLFLLFAGLAVTSAGAAAQEQTETPTGNDTTEPDEPDQEIADQLGDLVVHSYNYDSDQGVMTIEATWTGRATEMVTLTEMIELDEGGTTQISFQRQRLVEDERTEMTIAVEERTGGTAAVLLTTPQGTEMNEALVLQDGDPESYPAISFPWVIVSLGIVAVLSAAFVFFFVLRRKHAEEYGKERIA